MPFRADEDAPSQAPRTIGRYAIYGKIAAGGMATVHFGRLIGAVGFTRPVAIKRLHPQFAKDPGFRAAFIDEARMVSRIRHQNVVPTLDVVTAEDELFLVLDYVQGESLWRLMKAAHDRRVRVPPHIAITIVSHVLHGLHAAHEAKSETGTPLGIVHRDVSPQNILVGTDGAARVLDFGVARASSRADSAAAIGTEPSSASGTSSSGTPSDRVQGKLAYMAPEQLAGGIVGRQADIYGAAVVLWELLAGRRLFHRANPQALVMDKFSRTSVPRPTSVNENAPKGIDAIVLKGLAREAKDRYATAREMAIALEACGKVSTASEVGEWVERMAHEALDKRAREMEGFESLAVATKDAPPPLTTTMSALVASISPLALPTPYELGIQALPAAQNPPSSRKKGIRLSLASLLEPDPDREMHPRLRRLSLAHRRFLTASSLVIAAMVGLVVTVRTIAMRGDSVQVSATSRIAHASLQQLVEPLRVCPPGMAVVPGGRFFMGSDDDLPAARPAHHVMLTPYCIDVFETTTDDYRACVDRGDCRRASATNEWNGVSATDHKAFDGLCNIRDPAHGRHPINCVDWDMATQYCAARGARLPTEAEWEFAARGSDGRRYPWGDDAPSPRFLNACGKECLDWGKRNHVDEVAMYQGGDGWPTTAPVGSFPDGRSRYGVQDLVGNVWEWVADYFGPYDSDPRDDPRGPTTGRDRVIRGGAWNGAYADWMRPTFRYHDPPDTKSYGIGFRCASDQGRYTREELTR